MLFLYLLTAGRTLSGLRGRGRWKYPVYCCHGSQSRPWEAGGRQPLFPEASCLSLIHIYYALALDYNQDCVPGKGSAIFLHCFTASADNGSAGCIRLPEARAKELVQSATGQTRIVIAENMESLR